MLAGSRDPAALPDFGAPDRIVPVRLDVTVPEQIGAAAADHPDVDLVVSNAGISCYSPVLDAVDEDAFTAAMDVNYLGPLRLVRAFADSIRTPGGGAIFILSVGSVALSRSSPIYSASKAASLMMALSVREEIRASGGHVTVVLPGFVDTELSAPLQMPKASAAGVAARIFDGWSAGEPTVWPDPFAEVVRQTVGPSFERLLDDPRTTMTDVQTAFAQAVRS